MTTVSEVITSGNDDAGGRHQSGVWDFGWLTATTLTNGCSESRGVVLSFNTGLRFQTVDVANATTLDSATLNFQVVTVSGTPDVDWYGLDEDDSVEWSLSSPDRPFDSDHTLTTAFATGNPTSAPDDFFITCTTVIQEIIDRAGWAANNDLSLLSVDQTDAGIVQYTLAALEHATLAEPALEIIYTPAATATAQADYAWFNEDAAAMPSFTAGTSPNVEAADITTSSNNSNDTTPDVNYPAYVSGDLLIQFITSDLSTLTLSAPATGPNGETLIYDSTQQSQTGIRAYAIAWVGNGTVGAGSTVWGISGAGEQWGARTVKIPAGEFNSGDVIANTAWGGSSTSVTNIQSTAFTASDADARIVQFFGVDADPMSDASASGWTFMANTDHGAIACAVAQRTALTTASESVSAVTIATIAGDQYHSFMIAINSTAASEAGRSLKGTVNTSQDLTVDTDYGLSIRLENTGDAETPTSYKLQHNYNSTGYIDTTTSSSYVNIQATGDFADADDVPEYLGLKVPGVGTYLSNNNAALETDGTWTLSAALGADEAFELHTTIQITSDDVADGNSILFRVVESDGTVIDTYTVTPTCTIDKPAAAGQPTMRRWSMVPGMGIGTGYGR